jgi:heme A synthase
MVEALRGDHAAAHHHFIAALLLANQTHSIEWLAYDLIGCAHSLTERDPARAATIHGAADTLLARYGGTVSAAEARLHNDTRTVLQTRLTPTDFQTAYDTGTQLPLAEAIALAQPPPA